MQEDLGSYDLWHSSHLIPSHSTVVIKQYTSERYDLVQNQINLKVIKDFWMELMKVLFDINV